MALYKTILALAAGTVLSVIGRFRADPILNVRSPWSCPSRPAARPTPWRVSSPKRCRPISASRSSSRTSAAPAARSAPAQVASAEPDGYTVLLHHIGMATSATLYRKLAYDPLNAFEYVGLVTEVPMTIVARKDFEPADFKGLRRLREGQCSDKVTMANAGIGAASHLCGMLFMSAIETPLTTVPYKGTGPAMTDLLGGQVDIMCDQTTNTTEQIKGGTIKAYAVTTPERLKVLPDLPTAIEGGLPDFKCRSGTASTRRRARPRRVNERLAAVAAEGAGRSERRRALRRTRHRAVLRRRCDAGGAQGQARSRDPALEGRDRQGRRLRRLILWIDPGACSAPGSFSRACRVTGHGGVPAMTIKSHRRDRRHRGRPLHRVRPVLRTAVLQPRHRARPSRWARAISRWCFRAS